MLISSETLNYFFRISTYHLMPNISHTLKSYKQSKFFLKIQNSKASIFIVLQCYSSIVTVELFLQVKFTINLL